VLRLVFAIVRLPPSLIRRIPIAPSAFAPERTIAPSAVRACPPAAEKEIDGDTMAVLTINFRQAQMAIGGGEVLAGGIT
jgi:hypothetical protein